MALGEAHRGGWLGPDRVQSRPGRRRPTRDVPSRCPRRRSGPVPRTCLASSSVCRQGSQGYRWRLADCERRPGLLDARVDITTSNDRGSAATVARNRFAARGQNSTPLTRARHSCGAEFDAREATTSAGVVPAHRAHLGRAGFIASHCPRSVAGQSGRERRMPRQPYAWQIQTD